MEFRSLLIRGLLLLGLSALKLLLLSAVFDLMDSPGTPFYYHIIDNNCFPSSGQFGNLRIGTNLDGSRLLYVSKFFSSLKFRVLNWFGDECDSCGCYVSSLAIKNLLIFASLIPFLIMLLTFVKYYLLYLKAKGYSFLLIPPQDLEDEVPLNQVV